MFTLQDNRRVALWHEAGHAVAAMSMGLKIVSFGLLPIPHCLVDHKRATKEQMGILLCAGAMLNQHIFGFTWGHGTDFEMAKELGDLEKFKTEALALVKANEQKAKLIVETLCDQKQIPMATQERSCDVLPKSDPEHDATVAAIAKASPSPLMIKTLGFMARAQMKFPKAAAALASASAKLRW
jgi:hypothetical protein